MITEHEDYRKAASPIPLEPCPICGATPQLFDFSESFTAPQTHVVNCTTYEQIGCRDGLIYNGCLLYNAPDDFHRPTRRQAAEYWNAFARQLVAVRKMNEDSRSDITCPACVDAMSAANGERG